LRAGAKREFGAPPQRCASCFPKTDFRFFGPMHSAKPKLPPQL